MKKIVLGTVLAVFLAACGGNAANDRKRPQVNKAVKVAELKEREIIKTSTSSGSLEPVSEVTEVTKTGGKVIAINKKNGDKVQKGEVVMKLENQSTDAAYVRAKSKYESMLSDFQTKSINFRKIAELRKEKFISEDEYMVKKAAYDLSQANLDEAKASYLAAKKDFDDLTVKAQISGMVTDLNDKLYSQIETYRPLFTVVDDSKMYQRSGVSVSEINGIHLGNRAEVTIEGTDSPYVGKVVEINPVASKDTKKYQVKVEIENPKGELKKGMYSKAIIEAGEKNAYVVPKSAVVVRDLFSYIFIIENGEAREIKIERGYAKGDDMEIISPELQGTMELVVDGQYILSNRDKVNILKGENSNNGGKPESTQGKSEAGKPETAGKETEGVNGKPENSESVKKANSVN